MENKVMELIKEIGFNIVSTNAVYGDEDALIIAENEGRKIRASVTGSGLTVEILKGVYWDIEVAFFYFRTGELPDLRLREYTPELLELARRFGAVAGFEI